MTSFKRWFGAGAIVLVALALVACPAMVPKSVGKISPMAFTVGDDPQTISDIDDLFTDDDRATYTAKSDDEDVAKASINSTTLTVTPVGEGKATVTITATLNNRTDTTSFTVTVKAAPTPTPPPTPDPDNNQPRLVEDTLPDIDDLKVGHPRTVELAPLFRDDENDVVTYRAESGRTAVAKASVTSTGTLTLTAVMVGTARIDVFASDGQHDVPVRESFTVTVVNQPPMAVMEGLSFRIGLRPDEPDNRDNRDLTPYFTDPEGDPLTYSASVAPMNVATASVDGTTLMIVAAEVGDAIVTVTANDGTDDGTTEFTLMVSDEPNNAPMKVGTIPDRTLELDFADKMKTFDVMEYFTDEDGDTLTYTPESSMEDYVTASAEGSMITITAVAAGEATITVTASDGEDSSDGSMFVVTVNNPPKPTRGSDIERQEFGGDDRAPRDISLMGHFHMATRYGAMSYDTDVVTAEVDDEHTKVTLTPIGAGTTEVKVTPMNSGGSGDYQTFTVEVEAARQPPTMKTEMMLEDIRLEVEAAGSTKPYDLDMYFEDPDGSAALKYSTMTDDAEKVAVYVTPDADATPPITAPDDLDAAKEAAGRKVTLQARAAGTATITVTVTDGDGLSTKVPFEVTVVADNRAPTVAEAAPDMPVYTGATRLKLNGEPEKAIDDVAFSAHFADLDLAEVPDGDLLRFTVKYVATDGTPTSADLAEADIVATAEIMPDMWDGDLGLVDKFTVTLTPKKAGGPHDILIVATDIAGLMIPRTISVQVNSPPVAEGDQETPETLTKLSKEYADLGSSTGFQTVGANAHQVVLVLADQGYFSDKDDDATGLNCRFDTRGDAIFAANYPQWEDATNRRQLNLAATAATPLAKQGTAHIDVWCTDAAGESSPKDTLTIVVNSQGSIH